MREWIQETYASAVLTEIHHTILNLKHKSNCLYQASDLPLLF